MASKKHKADREYPHDSEPATGEEIARAKPGKDFFAEMGLEAPKPRGRPKADKKRVPVSLRVDPDTLAQFKATGAGWQVRMNEVLDRAAKRLEKQK